MERIGREEARLKGLTRYFTGKPCKHGHIAERLVSIFACTACLSAYDKQTRLTPERRAYKRAYEEMPERKESRRAYDASNDAKERHRRHRKENPGLIAAHAAKRRAARVQATPVWLTDDHLAEIRAKYEEAARLTAETGIVHHVDHEIPLQGPGVRGLHVPWNLRVIPAPVNLSKGSKLV